ncbi:16S rRNA (cytidine(1402)-2'-O)-methyltransferase [Gudongella sp. DL1XJH-153]|uniref:16S rRNA (cytidine(1402)-2'-O)-methyltransferase n=1 Tax=Gudongella sp. DL1XJH-153 TaxID=3409804 RepID=UPI003BB6E5F0
METGTLFICPTPIGNLEDITLRVLNILKEVDLIAAEDTRHTLRLLNHFEIKKPMTSYHEHNIREKGPHLILQLTEGKSIALVSDAGMPGISDPGEDLIRLAIEEGLEVVGLPGPSAALLALVVSGLPTRRFAFEGFLPSKSTDRKKALDTLKIEQRTLIFYESPHRISGSIEDMIKVLGDRKASLSRELTKHYEETIRGKLSEILLVSNERNLKGEMVLVIDGAEAQEAPEIDVKEELMKLLDKGMTKKEAVKEIVRVHGLPRNQVYEESLKLD